MNIYPTNIWRHSSENDWCRLPCKSCKVNRSVKYSVSWIYNNVSLNQSNFQIMLKLIRRPNLLILTSSLLHWLTLDLIVLGVLLNSLLLLRAIWKLFWCIFNCPFLLYSFYKSDQTKFKNDFSLLPSLLFILIEIKCVNQYLAINIPPNCCMPINYIITF